jgi:branched-chain amino acid transport system substrate-binding protein
MKNGRSALTWATVVLASGSVCLLSACGTRLTNAQIAAGNQVGVNVNGLATAAAGGNGSALSGGVVGQGGGSIVSGGVPGPTVSAGATLASGGGGASAGAGGSGGGGSATGHGGGAASGGGGTNGASCTAQGKPVIIGQDGSFSGLVGESTANLKLGLSVWVKYINALGGVACHPVQLYQEDNASDPSTAAANVSDLVKNKHAIALLGVDDPIVIASARSAADQLGVPIVGGDLAALDWVQDPNVFSPGASPLQIYGGSITAAVQKTGRKKIGLLYCVEASICGAIHQAFTSMAAPSGAQVVNQQSVSLTQSGFTSECQNLKGAGAQIVWTAVDGSALQRIASSCSSIGYNPVLETSGLATAPNALGDPNVKRDTLYTGNNELPYIAGGTPALTTFHSAFKAYTGADAPDQSAMKGWVSGQMFAAAINALGPSARTTPLTTAMVYQGLYLLRNETLGGLIPPQTYKKGSPSPISNCYAVIVDTQSGISTPTGSRFICP